MRWEQAEELRADPGSGPAERGGSASRRSFWPVIAVTGATLAFAGVIWYAYQDGRSLSGSGEPPLIKADEGPVKVKPDQPGGQDIPFQDSTVYDRLGQNGKQPAMEKLLPPPETPVQRIQPAPQAPAQQPQPQSEPPATATPGPTADSAPAALAPKPPVATSQVPAPPTVAGTAPQPPQPAAPSVVPAQQALAQADPIGALAAAAVAAKPAPTPKPAVAPTSAAPAGSYRIQLSAVRTADAVAPEWARLEHHYPDILTTLKMTADKVDVAGKGTFFRIQAGPLDQNGAKSACERLRAQGVGCIVLKP
jgi:hypothetical protein